MTNSIKTILFVSLVSLVLGSCGPKGSEKAPLTSGILLDFMDTTVHPGDDFNQYVNGKWLAETEIPADKSSYGITFMLHEQSEETVKKIIEASAQGEAVEGTKEQMVGDLFNSFMDMDSRNKQGVAPLNEELSKIDNISNYSELASHFGYAIQIYDTPFSFGVFPDFLTPTEYALYYFQSGLSLPDKEYYLKEDERSVELRKSYVDHIVKMLDMVGIEDANTAAEEIMALETRMAIENMDKEEIRDRRKLYNNYAVDSLNTLMPNFDWPAFLTAAKVPNQKNVIMAMTSYSRALDEIITTTDLSIWKKYLKWKLIDHAASYLNKEIDDQNFAFFGKTLYGREQQRELWRRGVSVVNGNLGELVGQVYVEQNFPPEAKTRMEELVGNLIKAYEVSIRDLEWMSDSTKLQAIDKLNKFNPKIGYPNQWRAYEGLVIKPDDLFGNKMRSDRVEYSREVNKLGGPIDRDEWGMTPQTVNAYYNPTLNEVVFPAAILQPPFFDLTAEDAVNYGAIGAVIGHEIGHGFDDSGSRFDGDGQLRDWWTAEDRKNFEERTSALVEQYNNYQVFDDLNVNGAFTLGENIGDLGGLTIALKAYQMSLNGEEGPVMDGYTASQRVFIGYAQSWRSKSREQAMRVRINSDPHSPPKFRVNGVVRNIPEFYEAFGVSSNQDLFLPAEERIKIW